jgi:glycine/D-amino acid oxidase-like deaminating enzyme
VGAGVFGSWTALQLRESGRSVALVDGFGPGNPQSSSGGASRVIRMGYGADEIYTRWAMRSLADWKELFARAGRPRPLCEAQKALCHLSPVFVDFDDATWPVYAGLNLTLWAISVFVAIAVRTILSTRSNRAPDDWNSPKRRTLYFTFD